MPGLPTPTAAQRRWQDFEVGLLYHFDLTTHRTDGSDHSSGRPPIDPAVFTSTALDTDQWLEAARAAGARYAIFTASCHKYNVAPGLFIGLRFNVYMNVLHYRVQDDDTDTQGPTSTCVNARSRSCAAGTVPSARSGSKAAPSPLTRAVPTLLTGRLPCATYPAAVDGRGVTNG